MIPAEDEARLETILKDIHACKTYQEKAERLYTVLLAEYDRGREDARKMCQPELDLDEGQYNE